ncbi:precorrin-6y C5,15-methyltransferase (decarboxylating), CbiE subunit,precorrin-6Y C5,15-methyltransferase (decarboxylating), CbiT subunit [Synechococcus sp. PCC 7502]|uniref:bifunctional cobalt-precorrin-7 (C(5))-methyltransferase/cobalt-precorrin-6B (C(15))-methyltransferase n=1 Tax=Synechococcus sp. PCC 7502 TaxID=1173263 RepID=UPI00029FF286|nr:bifunctional cobalt-precorrin-7 (C(5))-methyltransferase/cobalt-precorrin-6B (C(15))-methyltransferase [Synechococcus sp. PCC 7502]AFY74237.1 precorrin-6y C5,15-methyltransferase (decarboxylating), CbiE subunit,precorrin-6Y C5,15-methyltransferase (decarboxylating), CbiT subunit [Synechococcus sp. PCC 7502]
MPSKWLSIVGIGEDGLEGLTPVARSLIDQAEVIVGGDRHLRMLDPRLDHDLNHRSNQQERLVWSTPISDSIKQILSYRLERSVCVIASGDPMWYGIGVTLTKQIPIEEITIIPAISTFSLVCARLGWSMAEAKTLSLCGRPVSLLQAYIYANAKLLVLSSDRHTPKLVAKILTERGFGHSKFTVLEHLAGTKERIIFEVAQDWISLDYEVADLNAIAIECISNSPYPTKNFSRTVGLPDHAYHHDGQLTKREVRAITLSALAPFAGELLWDVGAGCGSIGIEWMRTHRNCRAIAIEKSRTAYIADNAMSLGVPNLEIIEGSAPDVLAGLPTPDAIFIGGGITTLGMIETCWNALRSQGRLVANVVTLEGEQKLYQWQQQLGGTLTKISIERAEPVGNFLGWKPMMPVTQWLVYKP